jgi:hypothetical protein
MISDGFVEYYQKIFTDDEVRRPLLDGLSFSTIDEADRIVLRKRWKGLFITWLVIRP